MELIVINQGIVHDPEHNVDFIFRSMLSMPIGLAYFYFVDGQKSPEIVELEMKMLNNGDRNAPVYHRSINMAWPIFWNSDDMPEIPIGCMDVFGLIYDRGWTVKEIEDGFGKNHVSLISLYAKYRNGGVQKIVNQG